MPKTNFNSLNDQTLELENKKWEAEMRDSDTLKKFLYMHRAPDHLKGKIGEFLILDINSFKHHCRETCDTDQQHTKEAAKIMCCSGFRYNKQRSKPNHF